METEFRNSETPPLMNILPTLLSDKVSSEVNCGGAQTGYLGRRVSVCKKGAKLEKKRGDLKAQHFFGLDEKTMG